MSILKVNNVSKSFGGVKANVDISMTVEKGKIVGLIGPNGSGKTTLFNSIVGTYPIDNGSIKFNDKEVSELPVPVIAKLGLLRTFQQTRIYGKLNCVENMLISHKASDSGFIFAKVPKELTEKGLKTLVLERGRMVKHVDDYHTANMNPWDFKGGNTITQDARKRSPKQSRTGYVNSEASRHFFVDDVDHPYNDEKSNFNWIRGYHVGGRSLLWGR